MKYQITMDVNIISSTIKELILVHDRVSLPGMGSFIAEKAPSVFSDRATLIHPPYRRILFRTSEIWNDGLLEQRLSNLLGLSIEDTSTYISDFVKALKIDLNLKKRYPLPDFGVMRATIENEYFFVANKDLFNDKESFGLKPVNVKPISKPGVVEILTGKPTEFKITIEKPNTEIPLNSIKETEIEIIPQIEIQTKEPYTKESEKENISQPEIQIEENITTELEIEITPIPQLEIEGTPQPEIEIAKEPSVIFKEKSKTTKKRKSNNTMVTILTIVAVLLVSTLLLYIFKDQLKPLWELILYSKEEREILRSIGK